MQQETVGQETQPLLLRSQPEGCGLKELTHREGAARVASS